MDKDRLTQRLMATFIVELDSHVRTFEQSLLALEKDPAGTSRSDLFDTLLRTAHSLKGAARSVRVELLEMASHRLEEIFTAARDGRIVVDGVFFSQLLPTIDAIGDVAQRLGAGTSLVEAPLEKLTQRLVALLKGESSAGAEIVPTKPTPRSGSVRTSQKIDAVRVSAEKLDALLRQGGELLIVRHRSEARNEGAAKLQDILTDWRKEWRHVERWVAVLLREDVDSSEAFVNGKSRKLALNRRSQIEQAVNRGRDSLGRFDRSFQRFVAELGTDRRTIEQTAGPLDATIRQTRMFPFAEACEGLERTVRDLSTVSGKQVNLVIEGGDIELDRMVLESIKDPLMHLVRNAVDHGIETGAMRRAAGKPEMGCIVVAAALRGARVEISVHDDGKGLDLVAIADRFRRNDMPLPDDEESMVQGIFQSGFSTSPVVTQISGRGVGLDIVKSRVSSIRGSVEVSFQPMRGTTFTLSVPLTLTSLRAMLVGVGSDLYAIDTASVARVIRIGASDVRSVGGREVLLFSGVPIPILTLAEIVGKSGATITAADKVPVVILTAGGRSAALVVDTLQAEREIIVRTLGLRLSKVKYVAGGTILPSGRISLILNTLELIEHTSALSMSKSLTDTTTSIASAARKRLLVVDDSATIRMLEKSILEAAGYHVMTAADGQEAWQLLLEMGADLVISDVEMPHMDGLALTEAIRGSTHFRDLPVILVTAKESDADKTRGMAVGANAYQLKSAFDQADLIATIERIL